MTAMKIPSVLLACTATTVAAIALLTNANHFPDETKAAPRLSSPPKQKPYLWLEPLDLTSAVAPGMLVVGVANHGKAVDDALLQEVSHSIILTDAAEEAVPFDTEITNASAVQVPSNVTETGVSRTSAPVAQRAQIRVIPRRNLTSGWHKLGLASLPAGASTVDGTSKPPIHRFRIDSAPQVAHVRTCPKDQGTVVVIRTSEALNQPAQTTGKPPLTVHRGLEACNTLESTSGDSKTLFLTCDSTDTCVPMARKDLPTPDRSEFHFLCHAGRGGDMDKLRIAIGGELRSRSGRAPL